MVVFHEIPNCRLVLVLSLLSGLLDEDRVLHHLPETNLVLIIVIFGLILA